MLLSRQEVAHQSRRAVLQIRAFGWTCNLTCLFWATIGVGKTYLLIARQKLITQMGAWISVWLRKPLSILGFTVSSQYLNEVTILIVLHDIKKILGNFRCTRSTCAFDTFLSPIRWSLKLPIIILDEIPIVQDYLAKVKQVFLGLVWPESKLTHPWRNRSKIWLRITVGFSAYRVYCIDLQDLLKVVVFSDWLVMQDDVVGLVLLSCQS